MRDHRVNRTMPSREMVISRGTDPTANVRRALEALGGMESFVQRGETVLIKPNVGWNRTPEQAGNSNPEVVAEIVRHVVAAGAARVWVSDVPVMSAERCFARSGISEAAGAAGARVIIPERRGFKRVLVDGNFLRSAQVYWAFLEADRVINVPIVKQHSAAGGTMAMKNWYGVLGGLQVQLHQRLDESIVDLAAMMRPTLTVLDATRVLRSNGPSGGSLDDVERRDTVAVGVDEVALDSFGATLLGLDPAELGFLQLAERRGLGRIDFRSLRLEEIGGS